MYWSTMAFQAIRWPKRLLWLGMLLVLGMGLSVNNSRAVVEALLGLESEFKRTPKFAVLDRLTRWQTSDYVLSGHLIPWSELLLCFYAMALGGYALEAGLWWLLPWLTLYASGYTAVVGLTLFQAWQQHQAIVSQTASTITQLPPTASPQ